MNLEIKVESPSFAQIHRVDGKGIVIPAEGMVKGIFFIKIPEENVLKRSHRCNVRYLSKRRTN